MDNQALIKNEIFPIPVGKEFGKDNDRIILLYSPFTDKALLITPDYLQQIEHAMEHPEEKPEDNIVGVIDALTDYDNRKKIAPLNFDPTKYTRMAILPNNVCNFKCSYCYSAHGRSGKVISKDMLKASLDQFIDNQRVDKKNKLAISILGGGEPMLSWDLVKFIIEYGNERSTQMGFAGMDINIVTNGSIFTQEMIDTIKKFT